MVYDRNSLGSGGPLSISYIKNYSASHHLWHDTLHALGVQTNDAHLSGSNVGVWTSVTATNPETATRSYSAPAYYLPNASRKNLVVLTDANVRELVIEQSGSSWVAKGVRFEHGGNQHVASVAHEVIVSAGSIASPQLLELSGIGNPSLLEAAGIPIKVANQNVGENLQDHISAYIGNPGIVFVKN